MIHHYSYSSMATWRRCRYRFYLSYVERYSSPPSIGQVRGTAGHRALAYWYKNDKDDEGAVQTAFEAMLEELGEDFDYEQFAVLERALGRYFPWARNKDNFEMLADEQEFELEIAPETYLVGFIDGILRLPTGIWLLENKFNKQASTRHLDMDAQVSIYMLAAQQMGFEPLGVLYNIVRMSDGPTAEREPALRSLVYRNAAGLAAKRKEILNQIAEMKVFTERGGKVYRNETKDCHWDCSFYSVCLSITDSGQAVGLDRFEKGVAVYEENQDGE